MATLPIVGRDDELQLLRDVLTQPGSRVVSASGIAGVGKSTLVGCALRLAAEHDVASLLFNLRDAAEGTDPGPVSLLRQAVRRSRQSPGLRLTRTRRALDRYEDARQQILARFAGNEPEVSDLLRFGLEAARAGLRFVPGGTAVQQTLTPELAASVVGAIRAHGDRDERRMLEDPAYYLGKALAEDGAETVGRARGLLLAFDEYEHVSHDVDAWLRRFLAGYYAPLPHHTVVMIAGRLPLSRDWLGGADPVPEIVRIEVEELTGDAVISYLRAALAAVEAEDRAAEVAEMLGPLGRLPVLLEWAASDPGRLVATQRAMEHPTAGGYDWGTALEDYVDRLSGPAGIAGQHRAALRALAVPRRLDAGLAQVVLDAAGLTPSANPGADTAVDADVDADVVGWLGREDFFDPHAPAFTMYEPVRRVLVGNLRQHDPELLRTVHDRLAREFRQRADGPAPERERLDARREQTYHAALTGTVNPVATCLQGMLDSLPATYLDLPQWATAISDLQHLLPTSEAPRRRELARLSEALTLSWGFLTPWELVDDGAVSWMTDLLLHRLLRLDVPQVDETTASHWLELFVVRTKRLSQELDRLLEAADSLLRSLYRRCDRDFADGAQQLLKLCVAYELAEVSQLQGRIGQAVFWSQRALDHLPADASPLLAAMTRAGLATNLKRSTEYRQAIRQFEESIACFRHLDGAGDEQLGTMQLELANCHAYLGEIARAGELLDELGRQGIAEHRQAELRHRLGWQLRLSGDVDGSHREHEAAVQIYDHLLEESRGEGSARPLMLRTLRAKAQHSWGNTLTEMHRFADAHAAFTDAIRWFDAHGMRRHAGIAMKDLVRCLPDLEGFEKAAEAHDEALRLLGAGSDAGFANADHIADGCLAFSRLATIEGRAGQAVAALDRARTYVDHLEREARNLLEARWHLERALAAALSADPTAAHDFLPRVSSYANHSSPTRDDLLSLVEVVRAVVTNRTATSSAAPLPPTANEDEDEGSVAFRRVREIAATWNRYASFDVEQIWSRAMTLNTAAVVSAELLDTYDEAGNPLGPELSDVVHQEGLWHRTFHLWLSDLDDRGRVRLIFQRRGPNKRDYPNYLDISIAGHYSAGEGIDGGLREAREELGLTVTEDELTLLARRSVDQTLYNGTVNREWQDVYWMHQDAIDVAALSIGYPEVGGIVRCRLDLFQDLLAGEVGSMRVESWSGRPGTAPVASTILVTPSDFIPEAHPYLVEVCRTIEQRLRGGAPGPVDERALADGSSWQPVAAP